MEIEEDFDLPALPPHLRPAEPTEPEPEMPSSEEEELQPEEDSQDAPETPYPPPETPQETQPEPKSEPSKPSPPPSGELAVFKNPKLRTPDANLPSPGSGKQSVSSAQVIAAVAGEASSSREDVAKVVDGFWDYVSDVTKNYKKHSRACNLTIPHFGTFRFQFKKGKKGARRKLTFRSSTTSSAKRKGGLYSSNWVDQWSGKAEGLSVRRRISVYVVERSGLPLRKADEILNRLLRTTREICEGGHTIHWARRGTMGAFRIVDARERDGINPQTGERIKIRSGRNAITGEKAKGTEEDHFCFGASKGFLQRLSVPAPEPTMTTTGRERERPSRTKSGTGTDATKKTKKFCCGCGVGLVIFFLLSLWIYLNDVKGEPSKVEDGGGGSETYQTQNEAVAEGGSGDSGRGNGLYELKAVQVFGGKPPKSDTPPGQDHKTKIYFQSLIDQPVFIYWVNFEGELESWGRLNPKAGREIQTYSGHVWLIADRNKNPLKYFVAERRSGYAAIRPD